MTFFLAEPCQIDPAPSGLQEGGGAEGLMKKDAILGCPFSFCMPLCPSSCGAVTAYIFIFHSLAPPFSRRRRHITLHKKFRTWWITSLNTSPYFALAVSPWLPSRHIVILFSPKLLFASSHPNASSPVRHHLSTLIEIFLCSSSPWFAFHCPSPFFLTIWPSHYSLLTLNKVTIIQILSFPSTHFHILARIFSQDFPFPNF
jgi:hypothetical protein